MDSRVPPICNRDIVAAGDFDGNGVTDLALGAPSETADVDSLVVVIFREVIKGAVRIKTTATVQLSPFKYTRQGMSLLAFDANGDGADDLLVGDPYTNQIAIFNGRHIGEVDHLTDEADATVYFAGSNVSLLGCHTFRIDNRNNEKTFLVVSAMVNGQRLLYQYPEGDFRLDGHDHQITPDIAPYTPQQ